MRMLLDGVNHVAILTGDTERFVAFYTDVFDAAVSKPTKEEFPGGKLTFVDIGDGRELNVFQIDGNG